MRRTLPLALALVACILSSCAMAPVARTFDPGKLKPTAESASDVKLVGFLHVGSAMRLYATGSGLKAKRDDGCISIRPLSTAGIVPPEYEGKRMSVTGRIERSDGVCGGSMTLVASDISAP